VIVPDESVGGVLGVAIKQRGIGAVDLNGSELDILEHTQIVLAELLPMDSRGIVG
jgi:hypothetical protein